MHLWARESCDRRDLQPPQRRTRPSDGGNDSLWNWDIFAWRRRWDTHSQAAHFILRREFAQILDTETTSNYGLGDWAWPSARFFCRHLLVPTNEAVKDGRQLFSRACLTTNAPSRCRRTNPSPCPQQIQLVAQHEEVSVVASGVWAETNGENTEKKESVGMIWFFDVLRN